MRDRGRKVICGNVLVRRWACLHDTDHQNYCVLEASSRKDAKKAVGPGFRIKQVWLSAREEELRLKERWMHKEIVYAAFAESA